MLYECNPMALAEQAGGKASDGKERISISSGNSHQRRSFFVGNGRIVKMSNALSVSSRTRNLLRLLHTERRLSLRNVDSCHWQTVTILPQHRFPL
ncbi:hypothetical protein ACNKHU_26575 [Shigella flexneri]